MIRTLINHGPTPILLVALLAACTDAPKDTDTDPVDSEDPAGCVTLSDGTCVTETFANPPVLEPDEDGVHHLTLGATEVTLDGQRHCVRTYNGTFPGPTIDTPPRDGAARQVRVNLVNDLRGHDYRSLDGDDTCACTNEAGQTCVPSHVHDACLEDAGDCTCVNEDGDACPHMFDFNVTNLHAHGSHVRPDYARGGGCEPEMGPMGFIQCRECGEKTCDDSDEESCYFGDDVLSTVHPGDGAQFRWDIDEDGTHHEGLQWYHPHIHGTTAIQVTSGAVGAWIVRGSVDELPAVAAAKERVMVFSTPPIQGTSGFLPLEEGESCTEATLTFNNFGVLGAVSSPQLNLINGQRKPRMVTPPGQVERWRILHAGFLDEVFFGLFKGEDSDCTSFSTAPEDTMRLTQVARDGLLLPQDFESDFLFMSPGYRVEGFVGGDGVFEDGETWCLVSARFLQYDSELFPDSPTSLLVPPTPAEVRQGLSLGDVVAVLNVSSHVGEATSTTPPDYDAIAALAPSTTIQGRDAATLCAEAAAVEDPEDIDQVAILQVGIFTGDDPDPCDCPNYNVNCLNFETTDRTLYPYDRDLPLGAVQHWRVGASFDGHPFHIHINPFLVCSDASPFDPMPFPHWRDTFLLNAGRKVDLIVENKSYTGAFVFHCHKLTHEDHGMMQVMRVCDPESDPTCGDYGWQACDPEDLECIKARESSECAIAATSELDAMACITRLGGPTGVCGMNACVRDEDCEGPPGPPRTCVDNVCTL
jgi:L-ascorbate oxidase